MVFIRYSSNIVMHVVVQNHTTTCLTVTALLISVVFVMQFMQSSGGDTKSGNLVPSGDQGPSPVGGSPQKLKRFY